MLYNQIQTFTFEYATEDDDRLWDAYETEDGYYYFTGHVAKPESNKYKGLVIKISPYGELVSKRFIEISGKAYDIYGIIQDTLGSLILCGKSSDTTQEMFHTHLEIKRIDYDLKILDSSSYLIAEDKRIGGLGKQLGNNNDLLFTGTLLHESSPYTHAFFLRLNQKFDSIRFNQFSTGTMSDQIKQLNDTTVYRMVWGIYIS